MSMSRKLDGFASPTHFGLMTTQGMEVFFDGACPLCQREIALLRRLDRNGRIAFTDVSGADAVPACPIGREALLARFHARLASGEMVSGARAFTEVWAGATGMAPIAWAGRFAPVRWLLDGLYSVFLRLRPGLQRWLRTRA